MATLKEINQLAIPAILYNIAEPVIGLVDTAVIGQMSSDTSIVTDAQAGIGLSAGLISTLVWGLAQIRTAVSSLISQYLGKNKLEEIKSLIPQSLVFSILIGIVFWLLTSYYFYPIVNLLFLEESNSILSNADIYYQIRAIGLPLSLLIAGFFGIFRGFQNTRFAMYAAFTGAFVNIILDLVLVNGFLSIPAMGVAGVAWASVASQLASVLVCWYLLHKKTPFHLKLSPILNREFGQMLQIAGNMLIRTLALNLTFILALRYASQYGASTLAAYSIGIQIWLFSSFFIDGYSNAGNAISGKLLGSGDKIKLRKLVFRLLKINIMVSLFLGVCYFTLYQYIGAWFSNDPEVVSIFESFFWIIIIAQPLNSLAFTMDGIYKGMGKAKLLRNTLLIGTFVVFIPTLMICDALLLKVFAIWIAFALWMAFRGGSLILWLKKYI